MCGWSTGEMLERVLLKNYHKSDKIDIALNRLFSYAADPRFGATPDGLIDQDGVVEIENPWRDENMTSEEMIKKYSDFNCVDERTGKMKKKTHEWCHQIQG